MFLNVFSFLFIKILKSHTQLSLKAGHESKANKNENVEWTLCDYGLFFIRFPFEFRCCMSKETPPRWNRLKLFHRLQKWRLYTVPLTRPQWIFVYCNIKQLSSVPYIGDAKIVVTFRVETSIRAQKSSNRNNSCFCPCAQDLKSVRERS